MTHILSSASPAPRQYPRRTCGFALVIALSLMSFLILLLLSLTTLTSVEIQGARTTDAQKAAKANAVFALLSALGQLQAYAGPDQRTTGTADLHNAALQNAKGTSRWTGVWRNTAAANSDTLSPSLLNWLVSGNEGDNALTFAPGAITPDSDNATVLVGAGSVSDEADYIVAPLMQISATSNEFKGRYAFWVGDEGVKGNIALTSAAAQRNSATDQNSRFGQTGITRIYGNQATASAGRLITSSATDSEQGTPSFWTAYDLSSPDFAGKLYRLGDLSNLGAIESAFDAIAKNRWHDITVVSQGLATDSRKGGLKTDLSLAFEMDDAAFNQSALLANSTDGHIYRYKDIYGPKWKLLRDYYRLYKDVQSPASGPHLQAQLVTPLPQEDPDAGIPFLFGNAGGDPLHDRQTASSTLSGTNLPTKTRTAIFPEKVKLAPVIAEIKFLISIDTIESIETGIPVANDSSAAIGNTNRKVRIIIDPVVKLWNPYNVALEVEAFTIRVSHLPIGFKWYVRNTAANGNPTAFDYDNLDLPHSSGASNLGFAPLNRLLEAVYGGTNFANNTHRLDSLVFTIPSKDDGAGFTLEPGQVKVFSCNYGSPLPLDPSLDLDKRTIGLKEGWQTDGGFVLEDAYIERSGNQTFGLPVRAQKGVTLSGGGTASSTFAMEMSTKEVPSGWATFLIYSYLFAEGAGDNRHNVKDSGADYFYNTAYFNLQTKELPIVGAPSATPDTARYPNSGFTSLPEPGDRQYLMAIEVRLKAEDESNAPLAQFSPTAYVHSIVENSINASALKTSPAYTLTYRRINTDVDANVQYNATTGEGYYAASHSTSGQSRVPLLDVPQTPLFSLGQLQNVDTSIYAVDPLLAIGNSPRSATLNPASLGDQVSASNYGTTITRSRTDTSYLLNRELWDSYFFSTIAPTDSDLFATERDLPTVLADFADNGIPLLNPNQRLYASPTGTITSALLSGNDIAQQAPERAAAFLMQSGQFNINSTSVEAWRALLGATLGQSIHYRNASGDVDTASSSAQAPLSRFGLPAGNANDASGWKGFRSLSTTEVDTLAKAIVAEIREHGPFLTLGQFVNRDLADNTAAGGLLERAIARAQLNNNFTHNVSASDLAFLPNASARSAIAGKAALGAPQMLLPADILSVAGHRLAARSDTFRIRAYGEALNPITNLPQSKAWLEAIVQRVPDYVDSARAPWQPAPSGNADFGRRFIIREIRFLSPDEV